MTCGNGGGGMYVEAVSMAGLDDAALDVRLRWLGYGRWKRVSLKH